MTMLAESTVLIVDDEPILNLTMGLVLKREGATVHSAANGQEALEVLRSSSVDAMVCDQNMPVMDGMTLLRALHSSGHEVPTLLFVSPVHREDTADLADMGVRRLIAKPIQPAELVSAVESVLSGQQLIQTFDSLC